MSIPPISRNANLATLIAVVQQLSDEVNNLNDRVLDNTSGWAGNQSNVTPDRSYNANATTTDELADVLGTLIADLLEVGIIK